MAQRESTFISMTATLFVVTFVAAAILGFIYDLTKADIELAKQKAQEEAIKNVLPAFETLGNPYKILPEDGSDSLEFFPAYNASRQLVGTAVKTYTKKGFSGFISIMAGLSPGGNITGYEVLDHKETPGLGSKMNLWFKDKTRPGQNIIGKNPSTSKFEVSKDGGNIDAITASTISSRAFLDAIVRAYQTYQSPLNSTGANMNQIKEGGQL